MFRAKVSFQSLVGKTLSAVNVHSDNYRMDFVTSDGQIFRLYHEQDCCEDVSIEDICGDLLDLIGSPILLAEEVESDKNPDDIEKKWQESFTWTFYKLATIKGSVTIRWYGASNGYYSESVSFAQVSQ